jgi:hypothetical protein
MGKKIPVLIDNRIKLISKEEFASIAGEPCAPIEPKTEIKKPTSESNKKGKYKK